MYTESLFTVILLPLNTCTVQRHEGRLSSLRPTHPFVTHPLDPWLNNSHVAAQLSVTNMTILRGQEKQLPSQTVH